MKDLYVINALMCLIGYLNTIKDYYKAQQVVKDILEIYGWLSEPGQKKYIGIKEASESFLNSKFSMIVSKQQPYLN